MPSWPARLHLGSPQSGKPSPDPASQGSRSLAYSWQPVTQSLQDPPLHGVPMLASLGLTMRRRSDHRPSHGRSHSHSFAAPITHQSEVNSSHDVGEDLVHGHHNAMLDLPSDLYSKDHVASLQNGAPDFATGACATCGSLVRWPRELAVFRCTVCLMVNDLKPNLSGPGECDAGGDAPGKPIRTVSVGCDQVSHLSIARTSDIIEECIKTYLSSRLEEGISAKSQVQTSIGQHDILSLSSPSSSSFHSPSQPRAPDNLHHNISSPTRAPPPPPATASCSLPNAPSDDAQNDSVEHQAIIFKPLQEYIIQCFAGTDCLNASFLTPAPSPLTRAASESAVAPKLSSTKVEPWFGPSTPFPLDAKTLLLGDFAENGTWWAGRVAAERQHSYPVVRKRHEEHVGDRINTKDPRINWREVSEWYSAVLLAGCTWTTKIGEYSMADHASGQSTDPRLFPLIEEEVQGARTHVHRTLLKASENLLRRPARPLKRPDDCRFLLILLANPLLYPAEADRLLHLANEQKDYAIFVQASASTLKPPPAISRAPSILMRRSPSIGGAIGRHSGIVKRILGLLSSLPNPCHQYLISWFSRFEESHFRRVVELIGSFISYRLSRQHGRKRSRSQDPMSFLIPSISGSGAGASAQLHAALGANANTKTSEKAEGGIEYAEDWQIRAGARVMSLLFSANNNDPSVKPEATKSSPKGLGKAGAGSTVRKRAHRHGQLLPTNAFYNTMLDYADLIADFEIWESRKGKFSFCQYPMFLSIWAKIRIMEHDARRQMEIKAREAFFNSIMSRKAINQYLVLKVRRNCLVEDSLRGVSEVVGTGQEEIKKGLRIEFVGEEGLDSGGLRKEWFLLLVREVFDPEHGLFVYDEDSHYCYFNPHTFETSDQFFLVGVLLGLAIYNSTILDVALPPFAFRKLLASAPNYTGPVTTSSRPTSGYSLDDLAEYRPALAKGLLQLLEFEGDVEATFCQDFVVVVEHYGRPTTVTLCPNGDQRPVTKANRREFVELYVRYLLDSSVARQYEPFKRGFFTVCGGNALSLFRPEEIELLIRGSDEPLDVPTLRTVAIYENWGKTVDAASEPAVTWFWDAFARASAKDQRKLLSFITASDRIPAMGPASLVIKVTCLGEDQERFPIARTCFNMIALYRYQSRALLEEKLWRAVTDSEGFGMK